MQRTTYHVEKMDCAAEEHLVRMRLDSLGGVHRLAFDLPARRLDVIHAGDATPITAALDDLSLGARHVTTTRTRNRTSDRSCATLTGRSSIDTGHSWCTSMRSGSSATRRTRTVDRFDRWSAVVTNRGETIRIISVRRSRPKEAAAYGRQDDQDD